MKADQIPAEIGLPVLDVEHIAGGEVYELEVSPMSTSALFDKGHRIRVEVTSSNFPRFARNLNTGGDNWAEEEGVPAQNIVYHSSEYPSQIRLPIVKRTSD